jgi:hypothetical protein
MQITVTIDVDSFEDIREYDNKGTIQSLDDVDIENLPECLEHAVDVASRQGSWRLLLKLEAFLATRYPERVAYLCHLFERGPMPNNLEDNLEDALAQAMKVRLTKIDQMEVFTHAGVTYEVR